MKILHILDQSVPNISGYSLRSNYILKFQKQSGIDVVALTTPNHESAASKEVIEGITYHRTGLSSSILERLKSNPVFKSLIYMRCLKKKIEEIIKTEKIDIIHAHSPILCGLPALAIGRKYNIPVVYEVRALWEDAAVDQGKTSSKSIRYKLTKHYETKVLKEANAVVAICQGLKDEIISRGISEDKVYVVPNGVATEQFVAIAKDYEFGNRYKLNGGVTFGFIGSFFEFEGLEYFIRAMSKLTGEYRGAKALIVGGGQKEEELRRLASNIPGRENVVFTGRIPHNEIQKAYSVIDVLVYPRVKNRLTDLVTPLKPLEAMAMEKAVIASDVGGLKELIEDNKTGVLFKAGDIGDLVEKMRYLAENNHIRQELGKNAREDVIRNRDWRKISERYLDIYSGLLSTTKSHNPTPYTLHPAPNKANFKVINVVGARPNFMKIAPIMKEWEKWAGVEALLVHTGQHYDEKMSESFFNDLGIKEPDVHLDVSSGSHAYQTAEIMKRFEPLLEEERPDLVLVVGDVNSTIACALAAAKLGIKVAHVEAGLRSFDRRMPEEINRVLTDAISDYLFTTEQSAEKNLLKEGISKEKIFFVGNVMIDTLRRFKDRSRQSNILDRLMLNSAPYAVLTLHRPSNVDNKENLSAIMGSLAEIQKKIKIVFPVHPRTRQRIGEFNLASKLSRLENIILTEPLGYFDFMKLMMESRLVLTDSGGIQEETTILKIPCVTLRENTERPITVDEGTNTVTGTDPKKIVSASLYAIGKDYSKVKMPELWDGKAAERIVNILLRETQTHIDICDHLCL